MSDVVVLCYHAVSPEWPAQMSVTPERFEQQLRLLVGRGYRGVGDEVAVLLKGQGQAIAKEFAEKIRKSVNTLKCNYEERELPPVSASVGVATTPPDERKLDLETLAEQRKRKAKEGGRNRVVAE
jgi:diguanylate cyclase (GGDEF)-like protein